MADGIWSCNTMGRRWFCGLRFVWIFFLLVFCSGVTPFVGHSNRIAPSLCYVHHQTTTTSFVKKLNDLCILKLANDDTPKRRGSGVYVRPSAAIERGSGFFVPGLEGSKVRILVGFVFILFTIFNHWYDQRFIIPDSDSSPLMSGNAFSESLAVAYGLLVLLQGIIEARKDILAVNAFSNSDTIQTSANVQLLQQQWSIGNADQNADWRQQVEWAASTFVSMTPATNMILIGPGKIVFSLGTQPRHTVSDEDEAFACSAALTTLVQSKSGRVLLPLNHVSVQHLVAPSVDSAVVAPRCAVLQRVDDQLCWLMTSDQLFVAFTSNDLQWLGRLAQYVNPNRGETN